MAERCIRSAMHGTGPINCQACGWTDAAGDPSWRPCDRHRHNYGRRGLRERECTSCGYDRGPQSPIDVVLCIDPAGPCGGDDCVWPKCSEIGSAL